MSTKDSPQENKAPFAEGEDDNLDGDDTKKVIGSGEPEVKFQPAKNGDAVIQMELSDSGFAGLGKEELMKVAYEPFWVRLRWFLFALFWLSWLGMIAGAIGIIVITPKCVPRADWQKYPIYQVFSASYQDSTNGTGTSGGFGDLAGIKQRLPYLIDLGVKTVGISPVFKSSANGTGYAVSDFTAIDEKYGSMADFDALVKDARERGISVILDFVPNHSSDEHDWFKQSLNKSSPYADYYIWKNGKTVDGMTKPPNNWLCDFAAKKGKVMTDSDSLDYEVPGEPGADVTTKGENCGSAWTWNDERKQYYYHQFSSMQPDLNLRNEKVQEEIKKILRFWLDKGVIGFRMDSVPYLFESENLEDEADPTKPTQTFNQPEVYTFLQGVRKLLDEYTAKDGTQRLMLTEGYVNLDQLVQYYQKDEKNIAEIPMNLGMIAATDSGLTGNSIKKFIEEYLTKLKGTDFWPNWVIGNHDRSRVASRVGEQLVDGMNMIAMLLPGTPVTYYGEEIGMTDNSNASLNNRFRTPMQWSNSTNAGFSESATPWIPVNGNYQTINVATQEKEEESHLKVYKELVKLRGSASAIYGELSYPLVTDEVFSFVRSKAGNPSFLVVVNVGNTSQTLNFVEKGLPGTLTVKLRSVGFGSDYQVGSSVDASKVVLQSKNAVVFSY